MKNKWLNAILLAFLAPLLCTCEKEEPVILNIVITKHPAGGSQVSSLTVNFFGDLSGTDIPMEATAEWWWEAGDRSYSMAQTTKDFSFSPRTTTYHKTNYSAPPGYILMNYYWLRIKWTDGDGPHIIDSYKVLCTE